MDFWGVLRTPEATYVYAGAVLGALLTLAVFVIVNAIVRDSPTRRVRRAERAKRRLDRGRALSNHLAAAEATAELRARVQRAVRALDPTRAFPQGGS